MLDERFEGHRPLALSYRLSLRSPLFGVKCVSAARYKAASVSSWTLSLSGKCSSVIEMPAPGGRFQVEDKKGKGQTACIGLECGNHRQKAKCYPSPFKVSITRSSSTGAEHTQEGHGMTVAEAYALTSSRPSAAPRPPAGTGRSSSAQRSCRPRSPWG